MESTTVEITATRVATGVLLVGNNTSLMITMTMTTTTTTTTTIIIIIITLKMAIAKGLQLELCPRSRQSFWAVFG